MEQAMARQRAKVLSREARNTAEEALLLRELVLAMDENRQDIGDCCRICGEREWAGPGNKRRPHHKKSCPLATITGGEHLSDKLKQKA